jgi:hypothetical protein
MISYRFFTCHLYPHVVIILLDRITSLRGEVSINKTNLALPRFIEVPVPSKESERTCICVLGVSVLLLSTILIFDYGTVPAV